MNEDESREVKASLNNTQYFHLGAKNKPNMAATENAKRTEFRPCIDLHGGVVKQIVGSSLSDKPPSAGGAAAKDSSAATTTGDGEATAQENFVAPEGQDSAYFANLYKDRGLTGGHVIMLGPGNEDAALAALRAYPGGLQVGGGITPENATKFLNAGASHVIVTSYVFRGGKIDRERLAKLVAAVGRERLVLDLSCRKKKKTDEEEGEKKGKERASDPYYIVTDRWQTFTETVVDATTLVDLASHCAEFLVHGVDVEGKMGGVDEELVALLGEVSGMGFHVVWCGVVWCCH